MIHHITLDEIHFFSCLFVIPGRIGNLERKNDLGHKQEEKTLSEYLCKETISLLIAWNQSLNCIEHRNNCSCVIMEKIFPSIFLTFFFSD